MVKEKKVLTEDQKKANRTFFLLMFPSLLLAIIPWGVSSIVFALVVDILVMTFQYFVIKNFVESVYS